MHLRRGTDGGTPGASTGVEREAGSWVGRCGVCLAVPALLVLVSGCADDPPDARTPVTEASSGSSGAVGAVWVVGLVGRLGATPCPPTTVPTRPSPTTTVQALDNTLDQAELAVEVGAEVVFDNVGRNEHNVIPDPNSIQGWGVGEDQFAPGDSYTHVFDAPGVYAYVCTIHGVNGKGMVGTITVTAAG